MSEATPKMVSVAAEIVEERQRQADKFGEQHHPDFWTKRVPADESHAVLMRRICDGAAINGQLTWEHIFNEEVAEALAERDPAKLRAELLQVAAVCAAWIEDIDSRK